MTPMRLAAALTQATLDLVPRPWADHPLVQPILRRQSAVCQLVMHTRVGHIRPSFGIDCVDEDGQPVPVIEEVSAQTPFGRLLHFRKVIRPDRSEPRVLIVAPLSGHFATLMRDTVRTMLADHDVFVAEWTNARDVPLAAGRFGLDEYIEHVMRWLEVLGPPVHAMAVCQPGPAVLAATALLAQRDSPAVPRSLTLMASPIDTSVSPNAINDLATSIPLDWFRTHLIMPVPPGHPGFGRHVYPGFLQLASFLNMNTQRHMDQHTALYWSLVRGDESTASSIRDFYDEYFAVLDMDGDFYIDTVDAVFQRNLLAKGDLVWRSKRVDPGAIEATSLLTVEGDRDDVCGMGQTMAAHELLRSVKPARKRHHLQVGVGHYGVFSGHRWQTEIYPQVREFILASS